MLIPGRRVSLGVALALIVGGALAGCGLISSDVTNFDLTLPEKTFTVDTGSWQVDSSKASLYLSQACASTPACTTLVQPACAMGCSGSCNATSHTCDLSLEISLTQKVDLLMERPELQSINDQPVIKVTIDSVTYAVTKNTLSVDTPQISLFVAPLSVTTTHSNDSAVKVIGTIDAVPAGQTVAARDITFTATGKADLISVMSTFKTPFNVLAGSSIVVTKGQTIPTGKLDAVLRIKGHAGI